MIAIPSALEITQELVRFDTRNPPGDEHACANYLAELMRDFGLEVAAYEFAPNRTSLVARLKGRGEKKALCFGGHIDVVPLGTKDWTVDPFGAQIKDGKLYGRGTTDMKGGIACFVHTALTIAAAGQSGAADIELAICAGEETGCEGSFHLAKTGALSEAGAIVIAEPTSNYPIIGHKGALWLKVQTKGITAHGSMPEVGVNAVYKAARAVTSMEEHNFQLDPHELLGTSSLNVGTFHGGLNLNSVPDKAEFTVDIRTIPNHNHHEIVDGIKERIGNEATIESIIDVGGVHTSHTNEWMQEIYSIMDPLLGEHIEPRGAPYFTDAAALTPASGNPPTVILGPGEMHMAHQTDEYCPVSHIEQASEAYLTIARRWLDL
ncbi:MAG TPA: acetylornithine deacetylase [Gammaproteobacteria bacterium]|nr:acetylornithine deacetylase [Gammaproteobacteria bacterium]|tara:strand:+ start:238 stop:1368 length:1131 start_codon:yes stop_codon:yes gene_type:complete